MSDDASIRAEIGAELEESLRAMEGRRLLEVLLQIVEPQINVVFLCFEDARYAVYPWRGGEFVRLVPWDRELPADLGPAAWYQGYEAAAPFHGSTVNQGRALGAAWNGHGIEISFAEHFDRTLTIQSMEVRTTLEGFLDCLRIGITCYSYDFTRKADA